MTRSSYICGVGPGQNMHLYEVSNKSTNLILMSFVIVWRITLTHEVKILRIWGQAFWRPTTCSRTFGDNVSCRVCACCHMTLHVFFFKISLRVHLISIERFPTWYLQTVLSTKCKVFFKKVGNFSTGFEHLFLIKKTVAC